MISDLYETKQCLTKNKIALSIFICHLFLLQSTMWIRKSIILLALVSLLSALPKPSLPKCPEKCNCEANGSIVKCPGKTTLKDWLRIGSTISENAIQLEITFADFTCLSLSTFEKLPKLVALRIFGGRLKTFPKGLPENFPFLRFLLIRDTNIAKIPSSAFDDFQQLVNLNLGGNKITRVSKGNFKHLSNLKVLNLENNEINCVEKDSFVGLSSLLIVTLDSNKLVRLPNGLFDPLKKNGIFLIFSNNKICEIQNGLFKRFHKIVLLDFKNNAIVKIEKKAFNKLPPFAGGLGINISNNPVVCSGKPSPDFSKVKVLVTATCPGRPRTFPSVNPQQVINSN